MCAPQAVAGLGAPPAEARLKSKGVRMRAERILIPLALLNLFTLVLGVLFNLLADLLGIT
jgi:hypothetical protein